MGLYALNAGGCANTTLSDTAYRDHLPEPTTPTRRTCRTCAKHTFASQRAEHSGTEHAEHVLSTLRSQLAIQVSVEGGLRRARTARAALVHAHARHRSQCGQGEAKCARAHGRVPVA